MKKSVVHLLIGVALLIPAVYLAVVWSGLPAQVPTHWGLDGQPNGYSSRNTLLFLVLGLPVCIYLLLRFLPGIDPKRKLDAASPNYQKLMLSVVASVAALSCAMLYAALHPTTGIGAVLAAVSLMFVLMGNYLTTVQPNYFVGIRTPWTLENPVVWQRTHRLGGRLFVLVGLAGLAAALFSATAAGIVVAIGGLAIAAVTVVYSIVTSRQEAARTAS